MDTTTGGEIEEAEPSSDEAESETDEGATEEEGGGRGATATASWRRQSAESAIMEAVRDGMEGRGRAGAQVRARRGGVGGGSRFCSTQGMSAGNRGCAGNPGELSLNAMA